MEEEIEFLKPTVGLGRIAAQMAKQVIFQKVREAERESVYAEYHKHVGEVVNCVVKRFENGDIIVELGKTEGRLGEARSIETRKLRRQRPHPRRHHQGRKDRKGPAGHRFAHGSGTGSASVPDRSSGNLRRHRADQEHRARSRRTHEDRRDVTREGRRSGRRLRRHEGHARAVDHSRVARRKDRHHPVERRRRVVRDQRDQPGKGQPRLDLDHAEKIMEMVVEDSQLSLAIGKKGQNVRLASKLIGWRIDIKSEEEKRAEIESQIDQMQESAPTPIENMPGLTPAWCRS